MRMRALAGRAGMAFCVRPYEKRLSCAAVLCCSQKQFYYDGRRQLQPLVRQTRDDTE